ncbi:MAG: tryptophan--tRNA ligase [Firmicutes bacterium]|nr:tryptophan--tRNA ligase [Bacillota bacterium]
MSKKGRILSGMRPTGRLHIGHLSVLENWVGLQDSYRCFFFVADLHALTTAFDQTGNIRESIRQMLADWLAVGIDPEKSVIFLQSKIPHHAELHLLFSMITPLGWLERVPTYKDTVLQHRERGRDITTYGFLGYPLLQAADILAYRADAVPVGEDQLPHLELCREVARRFNHLYGTVFPEPRALLSRVPMLPGMDGRKMSKSYANVIELAATQKELQGAVNSMITDPARIRKTDPGHPEVCTVHKYHGIYRADKLSGLEEECRAGQIGCVACKKTLGGTLEELLAPIRARRESIISDKSYIDDVLAEGTRRAAEEARLTMERVWPKVFKG